MQRRWKRRYSCLLNAGVPKPFFTDMRILSRGENHREGEPVLARIQTTNLRTRVRREHRRGALREVRARRSLTSVTIKKGVKFNKMRDIGDMHSNIISPVVKVTSANPVDCENAVFTQVTPRFYLALGNLER